MLISDSSGAKFYFEFERAEDEEVVVFSNSLGTDLSMWDAQAELLCGKFSLLRYDTRGHGCSSVTPGPYTIEQLGRDVLRMLDELGLARVHFCGLSMGGLIGQWLAIHAPDRIERLILSNTAAHIGTETSWNERIANVRANGLRSIVPATEERWFRADFRAEHPKTVQAITSRFAATDPEGYVANCAAVRDADFRGQLAAIRSRTLVLFGRHDPVTTEADALLLKHGISNASCLAVNGAHLSSVDACEEWSAAILGFLRGDVIYG